MITAMVPSPRQIDEIGRGVDRVLFSISAHGTQHATAKTTARVNDSTYEQRGTCALGLGTCHKILWVWRLAAGDEPTELESSHAHAHTGYYIYLRGSCVYHAEAAYCVRTLFYVVPRSAHEPRFSQAIAKATSDKASKKFVSSLTSLSITFLNFIHYSFAISN